MQKVNMINKIIPSKKIMSKLGKTNAEFDLIEEGDKILVGLSGGKDSSPIASILFSFTNASSCLSLICISGRITINPFSALYFGAKERI